MIAMEIFVLVQLTEDAGPELTGIYTSWEKVNESVKYHRRAETDPDWTLARGNQLGPYDFIKDDVLMQEPTAIFVCDDDEWLHVLQYTIEVEPSFKRSRSP